MMELFFLATSAILGFVTIEAIYISRGLKTDNSPDTFSWGYYWGRPRNKVMLIANATGTAWLVLANETVMLYANKILASIPGIDPVDVSGWSPAFTGGLIGLCGSFMIRQATKWMGSKDKDE